MKIVSSGRTRRRHKKHKRTKNLFRLNFVFFRDRVFHFFVFFQAFFVMVRVAVSSSYDSFYDSFSLSESLSSHPSIVSIFVTVPLFITFFGILKCLKSLFKQKRQKFNIVLVDNNSDQIYSKKILDWLKKKKIKKIKLKKNLKKS